MLLYSNKIVEGKIASGYFEALDLMKAISLGNLNKKEQAIRILNRIPSHDIIFIQYDYFLLQRYLLEIQFSTTRNNKHYEKKINELTKKTNFNFFQI